MLIGNLYDSNNNHVAAITTHNNRLFIVMDGKVLSFTRKEVIDFANNLIEAATLLPLTPLPSTP